MSLWSNMWSQTARVHVYDGHNDYGDSKFIPDRKLPGTVVPCRVEYEHKEIINAQGQKIVSTATMYCDSTIPPLSLVETDGRQFTVQSCEPCRGLDGSIDHYEIKL